MQLATAGPEGFSATFERTPYFFQEYGVAINALNQKIADGPDPNGPPQRAEEQFAYFTESGLLNLLGKIRDASIRFDSSRTDEEKKTCPVIDQLEVELTEMDLQVLGDSLTNYHDTTDREVASIRAFNPMGASTRKLEGGMAMMMAKVIEEAIPSSRLAKSKKSTVGFGRVLD